MAKRAAPVPRPSASLEAALDFIAPIMVEDGNPNQKFCIITNRNLSASDGVISLSFPIEDDFSICPAYFSLRAALKKSKDKLSITINDNNSLSIVSGKLKCIVPCTNYHLLYHTQPDLALFSIDDKIKEGFAKLDFVLKEESDRIIQKSLLFTNVGTMIATDGQILVEYWTGFIFNNLVLPKRLINIVSKMKNYYKLLSCGHSANSITFYFENGAWIKGQLYAQPWPSLAPILNTPVLMLDRVPTGLGEALGAVLPHSDDGAAYLSNKAVRSHALDCGDTGAAYSLELPIAGQKIFNGKMLEKVLELAEKIDFNVAYRDNYMLGFMGKGLRGFLMPRVR